MTLNPYYPSMQKTIAKVLILLVLFSNAAWAMDTCAAAFFGHNLEQVKLQLDSDTDKAPVGQQDLEHAEHCCHGVAHLIGMPSVKLTPITKSRDVGYLQNVTTLISFKHLPPTPPPTV